MYFLFDRIEQSHFCLTYLFLLSALLSDELIEHCSELLMDLLHLIYVAGNFVHGFHGNCKSAENGMVYWCDHTHSLIFSPNQKDFTISKSLVTRTYHPGGNAPHCLGLSESRAPSAGGDTSAPSEWVWSGKTPGWKSAAAWGCAHPGRPWNPDRFWLKWPIKTLIAQLLNNLSMFLFLPVFYSDS